jgi:hypothetical protein
VHECRAGRDPRVVAHNLNWINFSKLYRESGLLQPKVKDMIPPVESNKNIGNLALILGLIFFILVISSYILNFHKNPISDSPDHWGVLGDFVGGIVNPLLGLVTIWLLTVSLRQNNAMLKQAQAELKLAIEEIKRNQEIQASTEKALQDQVLLAQSSRDLEGTIALINYWQVKHDVLMQAAKNEINSATKHNCSQEEIDKIEADFFNLALTALRNTETFDHIIKNEAERLLTKYPLSTTENF